tara:strand:+ start:656 stop:1042 length:387 start_codon:yes stop_codon:yes gene_type:complete
MVCLRKAEKENKGSLAYKFWNRGDDYKTQIRAASKLIKKYSEEAVLKYLNSPRGKNVYSLGFLHKSKKFVLNLDFVKEGVEKAQEQLDKEAKKPKKVVEKLEGEFMSRQSMPKNKTLLSKLRKSDGSS